MTFVERIEEWLDWWWTKQQALQGRDYSTYLADSAAAATE